MTRRRPGRVLRQTGDAQSGKRGCQAWQLGQTRARAADGPLAALVVPVPRTAQIWPTSGHMSSSIPRIRRSKIGAELVDPLSRIRCHTHLVRNSPKPTFWPLSFQIWPILVWIWSALVELDRNSAGVDRNMADVAPKSTEICRTCSTRDTWWPDFDRFRWPISVWMRPALCDLIDRIRPASGKPRLSRLDDEVVWRRRPPQHDGKLATFGAPLDHTVHHALMPDLEDDRRGVVADSSQIPSHKLLVACGSGHSWHRV